MNQYDVAGILTTYAQLASKCRNVEHLKDIISRLKSEFNAKTLKKLHMAGEE